MDNEFPIDYTDLPQDELKLLLCYNQIMMNRVDSPDAREYYQQKINYISLLIKE